MTREEIERVTAVLRPFARAYVGLPQDQQIALQSVTSIRVDYLRDAYLLLAQVEKMVSVPAWQSSSQ